MLCFLCIELDSKHTCVYLKSSVKKAAAADISGSSAWLKPLPLRLLAGWPAPTDTLLAEEDEDADNAADEADAEDATDAAVKVTAGVSAALRNRATAVAPVHPNACPPIDSSRNAPRFKGNASIRMAVRPGVPMPL